MVDVASLISCCSWRVYLPHVYLGKTADKSHPPCSDASEEDGRHQNMLRQMRKHITYFICLRCIVFFCYWFGWKNNAVQCMSQLHMIISNIWYYWWKYHIIDLEIMLVGKGHILQTQLNPVICRNTPLASPVIKFTSCLLVFKYKFLYVPFIYHFIYFLHLGFPPTPLCWIDQPRYSPADAAANQWWGQWWEVIEAEVSSSSACGWTCACLHLCHCTQLGNFSILRTLKPHTSLWKNAQNLRTFDAAEILMYFISLKSQCTPLMTQNPEQMTAY